MWNMVAHYKLQEEIQGILKQSSGRTLTTEKEKVTEITELSPQRAS